MIGWWIADVLLGALNSETKTILLRGWAFFCCSANFLVGDVIGVGGVCGGVLYDLNLNSFQSAHLADNIKASRPHERSISFGFMIHLLALFGAQSPSQSHTFLREA